MLQQDCCKNLNLVLKQLSQISLAHLCLQLGLCVNCRYICVPYKLLKCFFPLPGHRFRPAYDFDYVALDLLGVYPVDSGVYTCQARNQLGEAVTSCSVRVIG